MGGEGRDLYQRRPPDKGAVGLKAPNIVGGVWVDEWRMGVREESKVLGLYAKPLPCRGEVSNDATRELKAVKASNIHRHPRSSVHKQSPSRQPMSLPQSCKINHCYSL